MTRRHVTTGQHTGNTNLTSTLIFNVIDAYLRDSLPSFVDMTENKEFIKLIYCLKSTVTDFPVGNIYFYPCCLPRSSVLPPSLSPSLIRPPATCRISVSRRLLISIAPTVDTRQLGNQLS